MKLQEFFVLNFSVSSENFFANFVDDELCLQTSRKNTTKLVKQKLM